MKSLFLYISLKKKNVFLESNVRIVNQFSLTRSAQLRACEFIEKYDFNINFMFIQAFIIHLARTKFRLFCTIIEKNGFLLN